MAPRGVGWLTLDRHHQRKAGVLSLLLMLLNWIRPCSDASFYFYMNPREDEAIAVLQLRCQLET
ncbi:hypothetical protein OUZ56_010599 [Daphnia magna]|uniref:Uncharacterized protein n=1 Tax=Daphnia magna TaxID=35525 RepID=A0ABR0AJ04_9CRUS|nr:hypothetical protein OUZ56_010599 [Daphnia magna]